VIKIKKILIILFTAFLIFNFIPKVEAKTINDMYNELSELEKKKAQSDSQRKLTQNEINEISKSISDTNAEIEKARQDIVKANEEIELSKDEIEAKKEETKDLLKFLQLSSGENVYLQYIFKAEDYTDFIYRYSIVSQLSNYNNDLMNELDALIKQLEEDKINLANKEKELEQKREELSAKRITLGTQLSLVEGEGTSIAEDIADLKKEITHYKNLGCANDQDINSCSNIPYASGWKYPLKQGVVTSNYSNRTYYDPNRGWISDYHYAIDIGGNYEGTPVYPAAAGIVARIVYRYYCGGNMVYIYHNVNGKPYTTVYMHLLNYNVSVGQKVTDTTVIGTVGGGYGTSAWETCSTGAHLHFGMAEGHNANNFNTYAFDPDEIFTKLHYVRASFTSR